MKTKLFNIPLIVSLFLILAGCQKENIVTPVTPEEPGTSIGNTPPPTWRVNPDYDYSSSMTAVVVVDLNQTYSFAHNEWAIDSTDLLGAFCGDECVGVSNPTDGLFYLFIVTPTNNNQEISLRYYSSKLRNLYAGDVSFPFVNGSRQGSTSEPLTPQFRIEK